MANYVDNIIAFRILSKLVTPFDQTDAFKLGVIDKDGTILVKIKDQTSEQKEAYDMLDRLVFSLKRLLGVLPGGKSKIASFAAAYYLVKEAYEKKIQIDESRVREIFSLVDNGVTLVEEELMIEKFLEEEGEGAAAPIANTTGDKVSTTTPLKKLIPMVRRKKQIPNPL